MIKHLIVFLLCLIFSVSCVNTVVGFQANKRKNIEHFSATIYRDKMGVPHIFGYSDADAVFGLGYAHSEDDFKTIQDLFLGARAMLGSEYGPKYATVDYFVHLIGVWDDINLKYENDVADEIKLLCEAYASGINKYASEHKNERISKLFPLNGRDVVAGWMYQLPYLYGIEKILGNLFNDEKPILSIAGLKNGHDIDPLNIDLIGSNVIGVSPLKSSDGFTRLLINTHQPWNGPTTWYEAHINSKDGLNMVGGLFPGSPLVNHGHNPDLGWSFTSNSPDLVDVFELEINPENENQYMFDDEWLELEIKEIQIKVKFLGPFKWNVKRKIYKSIHGPVLKQPHGTYAIRYSGINEMKTIEQFYRMNKSRNISEFKNALSMQALPMYNIGYADKRGNIFYVYNAMIPKRSEKYNWKGYIPGNTSETLWNSYIDFKMLPQVTNPPGGFFQNCNANPFLATGKKIDISPSKFTKTAGIENHQTNRSMRILELLNVDSTISREEFLNYKYDLEYTESSVMAYAVNRFVKDVRTEDLEIIAAVELLKNWNLRTDIDNKVAALAILTFPLTFNISEYNHDIEKLTVKLKQTIERLKESFGKFDVPLGEVQRLVRGKIDLPLDGGPGNLRAIYSTWRDGKLIANAGDCYIQMVEWSPLGQVYAKSIHQFGSSVNNKKSEFYNNQSSLFSRKKMKQVWISLDDIKSNLHREYIVSSN